MNDWIDLFNTNANAISALGSITSALAAIAALIVAGSAAWLSKRLLDENKILRLAGTEPELVAFVQPMEKNATVLNFVVANVGSGPAFSIKVRTNLDQDKLKQKGAFFHVKFGETPIGVIPPGDRIVTAFGQSFRLLQDDGVSTFNCKITYSNMERKTFVREFDIDLKQFLFMGKFNNDDIAEASKALQKIARALESIERGSFLRVEAMTPTMREAHEKALADSFDLQE